MSPLRFKNFGGRCIGRITAGASSGTQKKSSGLNGPSEVSPLPRLLLLLLLLELAVADGYEAFHLAFINAAASRADDAGIRSEPSIVRNALSIGVDCVACEAL